jgi:hypothetical protein
MWFGELLFFEKKFFKDLVLPRASLLNKLAFLLAGERGVAPFSFPADSLGENGTGTERERFFITNEENLGMESFSSKSRLALLSCTSLRREPSGATCLYVVLYLYREGFGP